MQGLPFSHHQGAGHEPAHEIDLTLRGVAPRAWLRCGGSLRGFRREVQGDVAALSIPELRHVAVLVDRLEDARTPANNVVPFPGR